MLLFFIAQSVKTIGPDKIRAVTGVQHLATFLESESIGKTLLCVNENEVRDVEMVWLTAERMHCDVYLFWEIFDPHHQP
ncbi:MAG: hypothetical protein AB2L12_02175 [Smithellaceae bacterium]